MTSFRLKRTGAPDMEFTGTLLASVPGSDPDGSTGGRSTGIDLYKANDGQYVVAVHFESPYPGEGSDDMVEAADSLEDVDAILSLYNPTHRLDRSLADPSDPGRFSAIAAKLVRRYDEQVGQLLAAVQSKENAAH